LQFACRALARGRNRRRRDRTSTVQAGPSRTFPPMIPLRFASEAQSASNLGASLYWPPVTSDVVIDLSHWQAPVDFLKAKAGGIAAVILKATQGSQWIDAT